MPHIDNGHLCGSFELPAGSASHEENVGSSNQMGVLGNDVKGNSEASVSDFCGRNQMLQNLGAQSSSESHLGENRPKVQNVQNIPVKAQPNPVHASGSLG